MVSGPSTNSTGERTRAGWFPPRAIRFSRHAPGFQRPLCAGEGSLGATLGGVGVATTVFQVARASVRPHLPGWRRRICQPRRAGLCLRARFCPRHRLGRVPATRYFCRTGRGRGARVPVGVREHFRSAPRRSRRAGVGGRRLELDARLVRKRSDARTIVDFSGSGARRRFGDGGALAPERAVGRSGRLSKPARHHRRRALRRLCSRFAALATGISGLVFGAVYLTPFRCSRDMFCQAGSELQNLIKHQLEAVGYEKT